MGLLASAKKEHEKKKKHPAAEAPESTGPAPDEEPSGGEDSGDAEGQGDEGGEATDPAPSATPGAGPGAGGTADAPQAGANQGTQQGSDQGKDSDAEGDDADQDQSGGDVAQGEQSGGGDVAQGDQDGPPSDGDSDDGSPQGEPGQGGVGQGAHVPTTPDGMPDFSKIPIPPELEAKIHAAQQAVGNALFKNEKVATAVIQSVVPGPDLPSTAAHMTLVIVSSVNKQIGMSKNSPQIVMPIAQWTLNHVLDMVEQVRKVQIPDQQAVGALGLTQEGIMRMYGVSKQQTAFLGKHLPASAVTKYQKHYKDAHAYATKGAQSGGPPAEGPSGATSPGGSAPGSPAGAPSGGGMVSQGAQVAQAQGGEQEQGGAEPSGPSQEEQEEQE